jgi:TRAP transporter 4TM/12TM fusion protein
MRRGRRKRPRHTPHLNKKNRRFAAMIDAPEVGSGPAVRKIRIFHYLVIAAAVTMSVYHVYFAAVLKPTYFVFYPVHLGLALTIVFARSLDKHWNELTGSQRWLNVAVDLAFLTVAVASMAYLIINAQYVMNRMLNFDQLTATQLILATGATLAVLEAARRTIGVVIVIVCLVFIAYAFAGPYLPNMLGHQGVRPDRLLEMLYMSHEGIFNLPLKVAADFVILFVLLGALLVASGAGTFFTDLAMALTGRTIAGPAKASIVSSALMGMLQGSSNGNVATTGPFTIPTMRRYGYKKEYAAGVEAVASTGGTLTPPIMGAAAFLMSEMTGIAYVEIMIMAIIPAFLYFLAVGIMVDLEARRLGLGAASYAEKIPTVWAVLRRRGYLLIPIGVLIWFLMDGYSPARAGYYAIVTLTALLLFDAESRRRFFRILFQAAVTAPQMMVAVTAACAAAGILIGIIVRTGLNLKLGAIVLDYASIGALLVFMESGELLVALLLTMVVAVVLGMGVPTSAAYLVLAALLAPGLTSLGTSVAAAHLFIIYCASKSSITPPVAVASYTAAAVAGSDPWRTSIIAFRLGLSVFIIPYIFVFSPALLADGNLLQITYAVIGASAGIFALSVGSAGWLGIDLRWYERLLAIAASIPMIYAETVTDLIGLGLFLICFASIQLRKQRLPQ